MVESDGPAPANVERAEDADAGPAVEQDSESRDTPESAARPDYDDREANMSEVRKPMGPDIEFDDGNGPESLAESDDGEPPVDPA